jgi:sortase (surface protein transpeptidase)
VRPAGIRIDKAAVDAPIETVQIVDGVMQNPSGPWVVSWYEQTAALGQFGNSVMSGHVDYYTVGPAVFWNLRDLVPGDEIVATGEDGTPFTYAVEWAQNYLVETITPEVVGDIVGQTKRESLTLITCGGEFNQSTGEYLERYVVRSLRVVR